MRRALAVIAMLSLLGLSACGGGGGGESPYTGLRTPAVVTNSNADTIARQAFRGGDLAANTTLAPARSGDVRAEAERPIALTLVRLLSGAATAALPAPPSARAPAPRLAVTIGDTLSDGRGGNAHFTLSVNVLTGEFTGTFAFTDYHGDGGGIINGTVAVSGSYDWGRGMITGIRFNFRAVNFEDGAEDVAATGTVDLSIGTGGVNATLNLFLRNNLDGKTVWLSNFTVAVTDLGSTTDVEMSGRIYLHDYGYVDIVTESPFLYPDLSTLPASGAMTVTGNNLTGAWLTIVSQTTYALDVDSDGDGAYDDLSVTLSW